MLQHSMTGHRAAFQPEADKYRLQKTRTPWKNPIPPILFVSAAESEKCTQLYFAMWINSVMQDTPKCYK